MKFLLLIISALWCSAAVTDHTNDKNPRVGNAKAPKGGTLVIGRTSYPRSLNFPISGDLASKMVYELVVENLCTFNPQSGEHVPLLAERWDIAPDGKVFTFYLNKKAKFSDGTPVTTKDVQAFWDILHNPKNIIGGVRSELSKFTKLEVIDTHTVKLHAQTARFSNLSTLCYYFGVTSHKYYLAEGKDFNKSFSAKIFGSGPYLIEKVKKGKTITLVRNKNYWGAHLPQNIGRYNFDKLVFRTVEDATIRFELFKKGKIDMFAFSDAKRWKKDTASEKFQKNWVIARRVDNQYPHKFRGIAINTRVKPFDDVRVRKALAHTYDRKRYIAKLYYGIYDPLQSYWPGSIFSSPKNELVKFDLKKARQLLREAGYNEVNSKGLLVKDGKPLVVDYLYASKRQERYLTIWKEDLLKVGIGLKLELVTWPTLVKKLQNKEFVLMFIGWGGALNPDPHSMWHSQFLNQKHGSNLSGFTAQELDRLLVKSGTMFDRQQRKQLFHRMDEILFNNHPFILHWSKSFLQVGYWNKFGFLSQGAPAHGDFSSVWQYAWYDAAKDKALKTAMQADKALPMIAGLRGPND